MGGGGTLDSHEIQSEIPDAQQIKKIHKKEGRIFCKILSRKLTWHWNIRIFFPVNIPKHSQTLLFIAIFGSSSKTSCPYFHDYFRVFYFFLGPHKTAITKQIVSFASKKRTFKTLHSFLPKKPRVFVFFVKAPLIF